MEKSSFRLVCATGNRDQKPIIPQEPRLLQSVQRCNKSLIQASQCRDENCREPSCQKLKLFIQHTKSCEVKISGRCPICKIFIGICYCHSNSCQEAKCKVPFCGDKQFKFSLPDLQEVRKEIVTMRDRLQQLQQMKRHAVTMKNRGIFQESPENSNSADDDTELTALNQQMQALKLKPMSRVRNSLFSMKNVTSCEKSRYPQNQQPYKDTKPLPNLQLSQSSQIMEVSNSMPNSIDSAMGPSQVMPNPGPPIAGMQKLAQAGQQLLETLKSPSSAQQQQQVLAILKANPQLMAALQRTAQQQQQLLINEGNMIAPLGPSISGMQRPTQGYQLLIQILKSLVEQPEKFDKYAANV